MPKERPEPSPATSSDRRFRQPEGTVIDGKLRIGPATSPDRPYPAYQLLTFSAFVFLAGVGGMFFRMARDNDDIVRAIFVFVAGAAASLLLARNRLRVPASIALPCLGFAATMLLSSFVTVYPAESMKEFVKIGIYLLVFVTLASCAGARTGIKLGPVHYAAAAGLAAAGLFLGYLHAHNPDPDIRRTFMLWSTPQVLASLGTSVLFCGAACVFLAEGELRRIVFRALILQAFIACTLGLSQFYGVDWLRPWDPKQPYDIYIRSVSPQFLILLADWIGGTLKSTGTETLLVLPRILGIYGNPDFFAPFLLQFIPLTVAVSVFDHARRWSAGILSALLVITLLLTNVRGAFVGLIVLAPFFGILLGYVSEPLTWRETRGPSLKLAAGALMAVVVLVLVGVFFIRPSTSLYLAVLMLLLAYVLAQAFYTLTRLLPRFAGVLVAAGFLLILSGVAGFLLFRQATGFHIGAIEERLVKYRMAAELWERSPLVGSGLNSYKTWYPKVQQKVRLHHGWPFERLGSSGTQENRTHNDLAQMLAETGVAGTGMFVWLMTALILGALASLKRWRAMTPERKADMCGLTGSVLAVLIYMVPNFPFHIVSSAATFWIIAGLLASYLIPGTEEGARRIPASTSRLLYAAGIMTITVVTIFSVRILWGTLEHKKGNAFFEKIKPAQPERAAHHFDRAVRLDPTNPHIFYEYGAMCFNLSLEQPGKHQDLTLKARGLLLESLKRGFVGEDLAFGLGHLAESEGDLPEALRWYDFAMQTKERHPFARKGRMRVLLKEMPEAEMARGRGEFKKARSLYAAALERNPKNWMAALQLGGLSIAPFGEVEKGIYYLEMAARLAPNDVNVMLSLFNGYMAARRLPDARRALSTAMTLDPGGPQTKAALERFRQMKTGQKPGTAPGR